MCSYKGSQYRCKCNFSDFKAHAPWSTLYCFGTKVSGRGVHPGREVELLPPTFPICFFASLFQVIHSILTFFSAFSVTWLWHTNSVSFFHSFKTCCLINYLAVDLETKMDNNGPSDRRCILSHQSHALISTSNFICVWQSKTNPANSWGIGFCS